MAISYLSGGRIQGEKNEKTPAEIGSVYEHWDCSQQVSTSAWNDQEGSNNLTVTGCEVTSAGQGGYDHLQYVSNNSDVAYKSSGRTTNASGSNSIAFLVNFEANSTEEYGQSIWRSDGASGDYVSIQLSKTGAAGVTGTYEFKAGTSGDNTIEVEDDDFIGVWIFLMVTFTHGDKMRLYMGRSGEATELKATGTNDYDSSDNTVGLGTKVDIGRNGTNNNTYFGGKMAECITFNKALSATEASQLGAHLLNKWGVADFSDKGSITNVPTQSTFEETDTRKQYTFLHANGFAGSPSWIERGTGGATSATTKTGIVAGGYAPEMNITDEYVGGVWSAGGQTSVSFSSGFSGGSASSGLRASGQLSGYTNTAERYTGGGIGNAGSGTWSNTGIGTISDARNSMGGAKNKDDGITMGGQTALNNGYNIWQSWDGSSWSTAATNMNRATRSGASGGDSTTAFQAGGYNTTNNYNNKTETLAGGTWTDSGYTLANPDGDALTMIGGMGGGQSDDAIVCLGDGQTACTFDGTANWTTIANQTTSINNGAVGGNSSLAFRTGGNITGGSYTQGTENYNGTTWDTGGSLAGVARGYFQVDLIE